MARKQNEEMNALVRQDREFLAYLLRRAIVNRQVPDVMAMIRLPEHANRQRDIQEAMQAVSSWGNSVMSSETPTTEWMEVGTSPKRGPSGPASSSEARDIFGSESEDWDPVRSPSWMASSADEGVPPRGPPPPQPVHRGQVPEKVPVPTRPVNGKALPEGVDNMAHWSRVIYEAPKFKDANYSYSELLNRAHNDVSTLEYVIWCMNKFGNEPPRAHKLSDFVAYVRAVGYEPYVRLGVPKARQAADAPQKESRNFKQG